MSTNVEKIKSWLAAKGFGYELNVKTFVPAGCRSGAEVTDYVFNIENGSTTLKWRSDLDEQDPVTMPRQPKLDDALYDALLRNKRAMDDLNAEFHIDKLDAFVSVSL